MTISIEKTVKYLAIAVTIVLATSLAATTVNAAPGGPPGGFQENNMQQDDSRGGGPGQRDMMLFGTVTDVGDDTLTVLDQEDESIIANIDDDTVFFDVASQSDVEPADVEEGDDVEVRGVWNDDDDFDAEYVNILPNGDSVRGQVEDVDDDAITLRSRDDAVIVNVDDDTDIYLDGEEADLGDIEEGMQIVAYGALVDDALDADTIIISRGPAGFGPVSPGAETFGFGPPDDADMPDMPNGGPPDSQDAGGRFPPPGAGGGRMGGR